MVERSVSGPSAVYGHLLNLFDRSPESPALITPGKSLLTFGEMGDEIREIRRRLSALGIGRGSRVGLMVRSRDAFASLYLGVISCATAVPLNPSMTQAEAEFCIRDFEIDALVVDEPVPASIQQAAVDGLSLLRIKPDETRCGRFQLLDGWKSPTDEPPMPEGDDYVVLTHTSGTTGRPKIVPRTNMNGLATIPLEWSTTGIGPNDSVLNVLPLYHSQGLLGDFQPVLLTGASVVLTDFDAPTFCDTLLEYHPSFFTLVPTMFQAVLSGVVAERVPVFDGLRFVRSSSAALTENLQRSIEDVFRVPVIHAYGSSEAGGIAMTG